MGEITLQKAIESTLETLEQQYKENNEKLGLTPEQYQAVVRTIKGLDVPVEEFTNASLSISEDINVEDISDEPNTEYKEVKFSPVMSKRLFNELVNSPISRLLEEGYRVFEYNTKDGLSIYIDGIKTKSQLQLDEVTMSHFIDGIATAISNDELEEGMFINSPEFKIDIKGMYSIPTMYLKLDVSELSGLPVSRL